MNKLVNGHGTGWLPDYPDIRDYTLENVAAKGVLRQSPMDLAPKTMEPAGEYALRVTPDLPAAMDVIQWCSPIEDQGQLGSCTAFAGIGLVEYAMHRAVGRHVDVSPLFLYKATRNLMGVTGDTGAWLRETLKALAMCGVAPEENWPYRIPNFDLEPSGFLYALGQSYQAIRYIRLDPPGVSRPALLQKIKIMLVAGFPSVFGFTVYDSIGAAGPAGLIRFPLPGERVVGGHAVCAVGYDDTAPTGVEGQTGALLIRNSWGTGWGNRGYGLMPYEYVTQGLADDWWVVTKQEWIDTGRFGGG